MSKIILSDGTYIDNLTINGDVFVSLTPIDDTVFEDDNDSFITVIDDENNVEEHDDWRFVNIIHMLNGENWICFAQLSPIEKLELDFQSKIDYIAMMTDVDIDF